jgi:hypothetical protein
MANQSIRIKDDATFSTWPNRGRREANIICALQDNKKNVFKESAGKTLNKVKSRDLMDRRLSSTNPQPDFSKAQEAADSRRHKLQHEVVNQQLEKMGAGTRVYDSMDQLHPPSGWTHISTSCPFIPDLLHCLLARGA